MRIRTVLSLLMPLSVVVLMTAIPVRADSVVYSDSSITITAIGDPVDPVGTWTQIFSVQQTHDWDQFAIQYVSGLGGGFAAPDLSAFSPGSFSVLEANANFALTNELGINLLNTKEFFTVTFAGSTTEPGSFNFYSFYKGYGERDIQITATGTAGNVTFNGGALLPAETQGADPNNPYGGYIGSVPLTAFVSLPSTAHLSFSLVGGLVCISCLKKFRRSAPVG